METTETQIELSLIRAVSLFKTVAENPAVRGELFARGLTDAEIERGWSLYAALLGFRNGRAAYAVSATYSGATEAAQALDAIEAWNAPAFSAARAVLGHRYPNVEKFLFYDLEAASGRASLDAVEQFLERAAMLRAGKALGFSPEDGRGALELLGARKILDEAQESELRRLIALARDAAPVSELRAREGVARQRERQALEFTRWLHEWRAVARVAIKRRDHLIALGLVERDRGSTEAEKIPAPAVQSRLAAHDGE
jgi:hypothetical protein